MYLDKASGLLTTRAVPGDERRLCPGEGGHERAAGPAGGDDGPAGTAGACGRALEDFVDREAMPAQLLAAFVERIEVGTRDGGGRQAVRIAWKI